MNKKIYYICCGCYNSGYLRTGKTEKTGTIVYLRRNTGKTQGILSARVTFSFVENVVTENMLSKNNTSCGRCADDFFFIFSLFAFLFRLITSNKKCIIY